MFGETQIRTGHVLVGALKSLELQRAFVGRLASEWGKVVGRHVGQREHRRSGPARKRKTCGRSTVPDCAAAERRRRRPPRRAQRAPPPLDRFSQDLTAKAASGEMDPVLGRDEEIRQVIDVLMRRRQNNPILTGEAGRRQDRRRRGLRPAHRRRATCRRRLRGVRLCALDIGLMQAGASMKGEFEQRLRSVIDEVQSSPHADHPVHRRGPYADRRRRRGRHRRRREPAEAGAGARHAAHHRGHHLVGIPPAHREGPGADPALPADPGRRARREALLRHAARPARADGEAPQGAHLGCGHRGRRARCRSATSRPANCPTRRSACSTRPRARVAISQTRDAGAPCTTRRSPSTRSSARRTRLLADEALGADDAERLAAIETRTRRGSRRSSRSVEARVGRRAGARRARSTALRDTLAKPETRDRRGARSSSQAKAAAARGRSIPKAG